MVSVGDTFYGPLNVKNRTPHLWIVIQVGDDRLLWVNITKYRKGRDESCVLIPNDHPFIRETSIVNYREAKNPLIADVETVLAGSHLITHEACDSELISKIIVGAKASRFMPFKYKKLLE